MDTLSETADKVDQSLQNMGIDGTSVKQSIRDFLDFKEYLAEQLPTFTGFCIKVVLSIIVFFVGRKIICWIVSIMRRSMERANVDAGVVQFISSAGKAILYTLLIFNIAISLGVKESSVAALLGTAGVTVGLALQGGLANLAGGVLLLMFKPFVVGDYIIQDQANGCEGTVSKIEICYTTLLSIDNKKIVVPNGTLSNSMIINVTAKENRKLEIKVGISYEADIRKAKKVLEDILKADPDAVIVNGYYCGHFGEDMTIDEITAGIRWHYEGGHNRLADYCEVTQGRDALEEGRKAAEAAGLPFCERLADGGDDELSPYVYDGSMALADHEKMQQAREAFDRLADALREIAAKLAEAMKPVINAVLSAFKKLWKVSVRAIGVPPKWLHLAAHAKKARTRKKYRNRIRRYVFEALAAEGGGGP